MAEDITGPGQSNEDKARNINSMSSYINKLETDTKKTIEDVKTERVKTVGAYSTAINNLARISTTVAHGVKNMTTGTIKFTRESLASFKRSVGEDFRVDKANLLAQSLAKATPIFGYFAGKFVESGMFKDLAMKIKERLGAALTAVAAKFREAATNIWDKLKSSRFGSWVGEKFKRKKETGMNEAVESRLGRLEKDIPKMQKGGLVQKDTYAKIHAGEVVAPIEKLINPLQQIADNIAKLVTDFRSYLSMQMDKIVAEKREVKVAMGSTSGFMAKPRNIFELQAMQASAQMFGQTQQVLEKQQVGMITAFKDAYKAVVTRYNVPTQQRILQTLLEMKLTLTGQTKIWPLVFTKMYMQHPSTRTMFFLIKGLQKTFSLPGRLIRGLFDKKGGYAAKLPKVGSYTEKQTNILGMIFTYGMVRLDNIAHHVKDGTRAVNRLYEHFTGKKKRVATDIKEETFTIAERWQEIKKTEGLRAKAKLFWQTERDIRGKKGMTSTQAWKEMGKGIRNLVLGERQQRQQNKKVIEQNKTGNIIAKKQLKSSWKLGKTMTLVKRKMKGVGTTLMRIGMFVFNGLSSLLGGILRLPSMIVTGLGSIFGAIGLGKGGALTSILSKAGAAGGGLLAGAAGVGGLLMAGWDAFKGTKKSKEWGTGKGAAGVGGFLGGTGEEFTVGGALKGVAKGAAIGAGLGSVVPGIGTVVGGAVGAIAGGIMGLVGGKNIAKGVQKGWAGIKKFAIAIWKFISWPYKLLFAGFKKAKEYIIKKLKSIPFIGRFFKEESKSMEEKASDITAAETSMIKEANKPISVDANEIARGNAESDAAVINEYRKISKEAATNMANANNQMAGVVSSSVNSVVNSVNNMSTNVSNQGGGNDSPPNRDNLLEYLLLGEVY